MDIRKFVLSLAILGLGLAPLSLGQLASPHPTPHRVLGYLDPTTGIFQAVHPAGEVDPATAVTDTGEFVVKFAITVKATIPKNGVVGCTAHASIDSDTAGQYEEDATGVATGSGTSYTCTATINYSWLLNTPTTDTVYITGAATIDYGYQVTASNGTAVAVEPIEARGHTVDLPPLKSVPANGAITPVDISATL